MPTEEPPYKGEADFVVWRKGPFTYDLQTKDFTQPTDSPTQAQLYQDNLHEDPNVISLLLDSANRLNEAEKKREKREAKYGRRIGPLVYRVETLAADAVCRASAGVVDILREFEHPKPARRLAARAVATAAVASVKLATRLTALSRKIAP